METLGQMAMVSYQTYFTVAGSIWSDLHQLYFFAVQQGLHEIELGPDSSHPGTISINHTYKQALLMSLTI